MSCVARSREVGILRDVGGHPGGLRVPKHGRLTVGCKPRGVSKPFCRLLDDPGFVLDVTNNFRIESVLSSRSFGFSVGSLVGLPVWVCEHGAVAEDSLPHFALSGVGWHPDH